MRAFNAGKGRDIAGDSEQTAARSPQPGGAQRIRDPAFIRRDRLSLRNRMTAAVTAMPPAVNDKSAQPPEGVSAALRALNPERSGGIQRPQILCGLATGIFPGNGVEVIVAGARETRRQSGEPVAVGCSAEEVMFEPTAKLPTGAGAAASIRARVVRWGDSMPEIR